MATFVSAAPIHRLSVDDVTAMAEAGILGHARLELVEGVLIELNPIGAEHGNSLSELIDHFSVAVSGRLRVRVQDVLYVSADAYVLPDLAVIEPIAWTERPSTALLVVEIAQTSLLRDREKIAVYARVGVDEYWIVDLDAEVVTVHADLADGTYATVVEHRSGSVAPRIEGVPPVALDALFGR